MFQTVINLLTAALVSYNVHEHVPNDLSVEDKYFPSEYLDTQKTVDLLSKWTQNQKMQLNYKKITHNDFE